MMRLAERLGVSLHKLLSEYHKKEIDLWLVWMNKEPTEGERIELAVAQLTAITVNLNSKKEHHKNVKDFMYQSKWEKFTPKQIERDIYLIDKAFGI